jgi:hypothetical protein
MGSRTGLVGVERRKMEIITNSSVALVRERTIPRDRSLSAKLVPTFCGYRGCRVVSAAEPYGRNLGFLDRSWR